MDKVRLGVLGAGNIAAMNVRGYLEDPRCDVVAVCDTDEEIGRQAAKEWGAESFYADLADLLADDSIDAVEVLTPTHLHHDHVIAALEAGKHVSVQKPVANSVEDALEMGAVADRVGRTLRISECFVHYPPARAGQAPGRRGRHRQADVVAHPDPGRPDRLGLPGGPAPGGLRLAPRQAERGRAPLRRHGAQVRHGALAARPGHHLGAGRGAPARPLLRAVRRHLRVRGPRRARHDGGAVRTELLHALQVLRGRRVLRDHRRRGAALGDPGHRRDARPGARHVVHRDGERNQDDGVHRPRRRLGRRVRPLVPALHRRPGPRDRGRHDRRPRPPTSCGSASPSTKRERPGCRSIPAASPGP